VPGDREQLLREYRAYDAKVDIVSAFEVFFRESTSLPQTVAHFERFARYRAADGEIVTPDFTVLFIDRTVLICEISNLARAEGSLESLLHQIGRYDTLAQAPSGPRAGGGHDLVDVEAVDVLVLVPDGESNAAIDRIDQAIEERRFGYAPRQRPTVMGWSFDVAGSRYIFKYDDRSNNPRPRTHGRTPSLTGWLQDNHDTLRCPAERLAPLKVRHRFMNDRPPGLYMATILWLDALPAAASPKVPPVDLEIKAADLAEYLRTSYGWGDVNAVSIGLEFLQRGGLVRQTADGWAVELKEVASSSGEVHAELLRRYLAKPKGPVTSADREQAAERAARDQEERERNEQGQGELQLEEPDLSE
jgi:hypothetical protein